MLLQLHLHGSIIQFLSFCILQVCSMRNNLYLMSLLLKAIVLDLLSMQIYSNELSTFAACMYIRLHIYMKIVIIVIPLIVFTIFVLIS